MTPVASSFQQVMEKSSNSFRREKRERELALKKVLCCFTRALMTEGLFKEKRGAVTDWRPIYIRGFSGLLVSSPTTADQQSRSSAVHA
jgi:hypothetical protein